MKRVKDTAPSSLVVYDEEEMKEVIKGFVEAYKIAARSTIAMVGFIVFIVALVIGGMVWLVLILNKPVPPAIDNSIYLEGGTYTSGGDFIFKTGQ